MTINSPLGHLKISRGSAETIIESISASVSRKERNYCIPINITKYGMSKSDTKLRDAINSAGVVIADGLPISWMARRRGYADVQRCTGIELAEALLGKAAQRGWRVFFLGTTAESLQRAVSVLQRRHPRLKVAGFHHGYFGAHQEHAVVSEINAADTNLLLIGLGLPQKEYFITDHWPQLKADFCLAIGGALDVWAGAKRRAPRFVQAAGCEWLFRSFYDVRKSKTLLQHGVRFFKDYCR